jgi:hypothetical protein
MTGPRRRRQLAGTASAVAVLTLTACASTPVRDGSTGQTATGPSSQDSAPTSGTPALEPSNNSQSSAATPQEDDVQTIHIQVGDKLFSATVEDSAAGRDLLAQLPQTIEMSDHGGVEKTGPLASPLSLDGQPDGADPHVGDLGYYAPGNDLVLYYGDQSYYDGIVVLGRLDDQAASRLAQMDGGITVTVTTPDTP